MLLYYLKETLNSLFKSKLATLLIVTTTTIAIMFVLSSIGLLVFSNTINNRLKDNIQINLFVSDTISQSNNKQIEKELSDNIYIQSFNYVSKKEAMRRMKRRTGSDFLSVLEANPLPAMFAVKLQADSVNAFSINPIIENFKKIHGIDEVVYDYTLTLKILNIIHSSKKVIYGVSLFLVFLSIYLVYSNNRLVLTSRMNEYNTMKLVGAKLRTIKIPILLNGIVIGLISAVLSLGIVYSLFQFGSKIYDTSFIEPQQKYIIGLVFLLGIILGFLGSYLSTLNVTLKINKIKS